MAIVPPGSACALCARPLDGLPSIAFDPFVPNRLDPLHVLSDAAVHRDCLMRDPALRGALQVTVTLDALRLPSARRCVVCGRPPTRPEEEFCTGYLSSRTGSLLESLNYVCLHREHFPDWVRAAALRAAVASEMGPRDWDGPQIVIDPFPRWVAR